MPSAVEQDASSDALKRARELCRYVPKSAIP